MTIHPILLDGQWRAADAASTFQAIDPARCEPLSGEYPVSRWSDCEAALAAAAQAAVELERASAEQVAAFLERFAERIEARKDELVASAHAETALPRSPRLADGELPRTTGQLRQAAAACREGSWRNVVIDTAAGIRSCLAPIGPVCVFGPNNFPFAFGSCSGGDFAAAIAAGNPVIAKANTSHPGTTRLFAEEASLAVAESGLPRATVQLLYRTSHADGERLVADHRVGATGYTGSRSAGLQLKRAADAAGKPIYLELSSVNPVFVLPAALRERGDKIVEEFTGSCLMGVGQFCTNPGLVVLVDDERSRAFVDAVAQRFSAAPVGTLLSRGVADSLRGGLDKLVAAGAEVRAGNTAGGGAGFSHSNTLLTIRGAQFLADPEVFQTEAFGNASLFVLAESSEQLSAIAEQMEGNLTGCVYSDTAGGDDALYDDLAPALRRRVGRLLNDRMPTGVAVSPAMNHGGPFPATGHPGFTAVGIPAAMVRFGMLQCFDNVRPHRLPSCLQDASPNGTMWRRIDGRWTQGSV